MSDWTDELKKEIVDAYLDRDPTPENSMDIVKELADEYEKTPNGVRMILMKADVYVKKEPAKKADPAKKDIRTNKEAALTKLKETIANMGKTVDEDIINKLTGKAANYFTSILVEE